MSYSKATIAALFLTAIVGTKAFANDTTAELKTGGLNFTHIDTVEMAKEDLFISPTKVEVNYVFHNTSTKDVTTLVAFPMPDMTGDLDPGFVYGNGEDEKWMDDDNWLNFAASQDGVDVKPEMQQRVSVAGVDMTDLFDKAKIPKRPFSQTTIKALEKLSPDEQKDWVDRGLIYVESEDDGAVTITPIWTLSTTFFWKTTFPAGKDVAVHHTYRPSVGVQNAIYFLNDDGEAKGDEYNRYVSTYCIDDNIVKISKENNDNMDSGKPYYDQRWISYILRTAGNWGFGSIGDFHLTIDKGDKDTILSMCADGLKKTGPTTFELRAKDYLPARDLDILLLVKEQPMQQ